MGISATFGLMLAAGLGIGVPAGFLLYSYAPGSAAETAADASEARVHRLQMMAVGAPAPRILAPPVEPEPTEPVEDDAAKNAAAKAEAEPDSGLKPVPFTPRGVPASTRRATSPDLRDPFVVARRTPTRSQAAVHGDLRDPFATHRGMSRERAPSDLRDPFEQYRTQPKPTQDAPRCKPTTDDGVKIQRPKSLRRDACPEAAYRDNGWYAALDL